MTEKAQSGARDGVSTLLVGVAKNMLWTPKRLRWDAEASNELSWALCFLYAAVRYPDKWDFEVALPSIGNPRMC